jgi:hypothetical protein
VTSQYNEVYQRFKFEHLQAEVEMEIFENSEIIEFFSKPTNIAILIEKNEKESDQCFILKIKCESELKKMSSDRAEALSDLISDCFFYLVEKQFGESGKEELLENFGGCTVIFNEKVIY